MENEKDIFKEAELQKLKSEIARNEAEQLKLSSEAEEINKRKGSPNSLQPCV